MTTMRANRERGEHGTENAGSCSGPNGDALLSAIRAHLPHVRYEDCHGEVLDRLDRAVWAELFGAGDWPFGEVAL